MRAAALRGAGHVLARFGAELPLAELGLLYPALAELGDGLYWLHTRPLRAGNRGKAAGQQQT